jgi:hypothetical protein
MTHGTCSRPQIYRPLGLMSISRFAQHLFKDQRIHQLDRLAENNDGLNALTSLSPAYPK